MWHTRIGAAHRSAAGAGPAAARRGAALPCAGRGTARTGAEPREERGGEGEGWLERVGGRRGGGKFHKVE